MFWFFLLTAFFATAHASVEHTGLHVTMLNDPSALVEGKINAITGEPCIAELDMTIQGAEPIHIDRMYVSELNPKKEKQWKWSISNTFAFYEQDSKEYRCIISEKNGCPLIFKKAHSLTVNGKKCFRFDPSDLNKGFSNTHHGFPSSRTNVKNDYLIIEGHSTDPSDVKFITYHSANGSVREYKKVHDSNEPKIRTFRLLSEHLPNGHWIFYDYEETTEIPPSSWLGSVFGGNKERPKFWLKSIRTTSPDQSRVFARADFIYENRDEKSFQYYILGSDGQTAKYRNHSGRLGEFTPANGVFQQIDYVDCWGINQLQTIQSPQNRKWTLDYYRKEKEKVAGVTIKMDDEFGKDKRRCRVKTISAPVGEDEKLYVTHSFVYDLDRIRRSDDYDDHVTTVYDVDGNYAEYRARSDLRLWQINHFDKTKKLLLVDKFKWSSNGHLECKILMDGNKKPVLAKKYIYDTRGNVMEEKLYGNLSGKGRDLVLGFNEEPTENGVEIHGKRYRYSTGEPNLLLEEEEPSGKRTTYEYLAGTDLLVSCLVYDQIELKLRTFYEYDKDHLLVREIQDDGHFPDKNNLAGVQVRTIREFQHCRVGAYYGMPETITEKYWEKGRELVLKKTVLSYTTGGRIAQKEIYDAGGMLRFCLKFKYDARGNLMEETNALGQTKHSSYDLCNNCIWTEDFPGRITCTLDYDHSNRPTAITCHGDDGLVQRRSYRYDKKHRLIQEINAQGAISSHAYDPLGRKIQTELPPLPTPQGTLQTPIIQMAYDSAGNEIIRIEWDPLESTCRHASLSIL